MYFSTFKETENFLNEKGRPGNSKFVELHIVLLFLSIPVDIPIK